MDVYDIERWCLEGGGEVIGRTLLLPLSHPQAWEPGPLPPELDGVDPMPGRPLEAARHVLERTGLPIAVGFALIAELPGRPIAHAFNVRGHSAIDLALAGHRPVGYWAYVPTAEQLAIDSRSLEREAPAAGELDGLRETAG